MAAVVDVEAELAGVVDALCAADPLRLGDGETLVGLHRQFERLGACLTRAVAAFDAGRSWEAEGARTASAWLATCWKVPQSATRRRVQLGRALRDMPLVEAAWLAGEMGEAQVGLFASARTAETAACFERDQAMLVAQAKRLGYRSFVRGLAYWSQLADPEGTERSAQRQHADRHLHLAQSFGGGWILEGFLDPVNGAVVANALGTIEQELFEADWAEARARRGEAACGGDLLRTARQRRADALVEMARRALAVPVGARMPEPLFTVLVGYETFAGRICELAGATVVSPGSLVPWLEEAWVERVVFDGPDRVKDVGVRTRLFTGATRRAVQVRDRECFHPYCDVAAEHCEVDHVRPWSEGGQTVEGNGRVACGFHNRERHRPRPPPQAPPP